MSLDSLPLELVTLICLSLDRKSLFTARFINRMFYRLFSHHKILEYHLELYRAGMDDGPPNRTLSVASRLDRLKKYQAGWSKLALTSPKDVPTFGDILNVTGSLLSQGTTYGPEEVRDCRSSVQFWKLSNSLGDPHDFEVLMEHTIASYAVDPSQDLLVVTENFTSPVIGPGCMNVKIYLYKLSEATGTRHPRAKVLTLEQSVYRDSCGGEISICKNFVGAMFKPSTMMAITAGATNVMTKSQAVIWNWQTGQCIFNVTDVASSFTFLSDQHILLTVLSNNQEQVQTAALTLVDFHLPSTQSSCHVVASLMFPDFRSGKKITGVEIDTSPVQAHVPAEHHLSPAVPFQLSWDNRLFVLSFGRELDVSRDRFGPSLFIPLSTFLPYLHNTPQNTNMSLPDCYIGGSVPWMNWGPRGSRMLILDDEIDADCVYGSRFGQIVYKQDAHEALPHVEVLDFNTSAPRSGLLGSHDSAMDVDTVSATEVVIEPTTISVEELGLFTSDVVTYLPYRRTITNHQLNIERLMLGEEHIVAINGYGSLVYYALIPST